MEDYKERLIVEQKELKEKLIKLMEFINSEKFYELSENNKQLLKNQKIAMELYLSTLNMRLFDDVDKITVPDLGMLQLMGGVFGNTWSKPVIPVRDKPVNPEEFNTEGVDRIPIVS